MDDLWFPMMKRLAAAQLRIFSPFKRAAQLPREASKKNPKRLAGADFCGKRNMAQVLSQQEKTCASVAGSKLGR
ncbi:hypothetical protein [Paraburkholderia oxyphila]|uniref:hypothetical protein n=1 Tax=Paraburkholderia oxyphila TaxID=614212 RepID=UPI0012ED0943|nr:hypothetical protein [Paraburkholderia oxyphila]